MARPTGSRLGGYEILRPLGEGGMGEVYRARDTELGREVAVKLLLDELSSDPERLARFEHEARVLASLNHPNVATLHGFERDGENRFLVMELVEGESLADRIAQGPLTIDQALPLFLDIVSGLEAAHERGIVHRDLKPANLKISSQGTVKILDFGLAKASLREDVPRADLDTPTITAPEYGKTQRGQVLGTPAYMSPEQARGEPVDSRTDIWALGVCLLEALTGRRVFSGDSATEVVASVLKDEPDLDTLPAETPRAVRRLLRRCLVKERKNRLPHITAARLELLDALAEEGELDWSGDPEKKRRPSMLWLAAAAIAASLASGLSVWFLKPAPIRQPVRSVVSIAPSEPVDPSHAFHDVALTADGRTAVYRSARSLYVRRVDQLEGTALPGTESAQNPFVSPDGQWVGYTEADSLEKVPLGGGPAIEICRIPSRILLYPSWTDDGSVLFGLHFGEGLYRVPAEGGTPQLVVEPDREDGERYLAWPHLLPGSRTLLYTAVLDEKQGRVMAIDLATGHRQVLVAAGGRAIFLATGHLLYRLDNDLLAVRFDPVDLTVDGDPQRVLAGVSENEWFGADFAVSRTGDLVYVPAALRSQGRRALVWVDRSGHEEPMDAPLRRYYSSPVISPDGQRVALSTAGAGLLDVWVWDTRRKTATRVTGDTTSDLYPVWTADGRSLILASGPMGQVGLARTPATGTGEPAPLAENPTDGPDPNLYPTSLSADGRILLFHRGTRSAFDLGMLDLEGGDPRLLLAESYDELNGELSPNGRFLVYQSNESGPFEIYVRPFPDIDRDRWTISSGGGTEPRWSPDGESLFYRSGENFIEVPVRTEPTFEAGTPVTLFSGDWDLADWTDPKHKYDVHPDGERFVMIKTLGSDADPTGEPQVVLVQNWLQELERLVPRG